MIRDVLDTNIVISALLSPHGPPAQVFLLALIDPNVQLCISGEVFAEYEDVMHRPRLRRSRTEITNALAAIREKALWFRAHQKLRVCSDPDDNIFLECAQAAHANYLITGNTKDFPPLWVSTQIVTPRQFLDSVT